MNFTNDEKAQIYVAIDAFHDQYPADFHDLWLRIRKEWYGVEEMEWDDQD